MIDIQVGKFYKTAHGDKAYIEQYKPYGQYRWFGTVYHADGTWSDCNWTKSGRFLRERHEPGDWPNDLVSEWVWTNG